MRWKNTKQHQRPFLGYAMHLLPILPGCVTFHHLGRYNVYHEKTFARWFACAFDCVSLPMLYHQVVKHMHLKRHLRLVLVHHRPSECYPLLLSTDVALSAQTIYRYDKARFQIALLDRDAQ
jgi:hypothetical protein